MSNSEDLKDRGLQSITKYVSLFWDEHNGFTARINDTVEQCIYDRGYGDFAGHCSVECIIPIEYEGVDGND